MFANVRRGKRPDVVVQLHKSITAKWKFSTFPSTWAKPGGNLKRFHSLPFQTALISSQSFIKALFPHFQPFDSRNFIQEAP
jgi:hypothetical protein